MADDDTGRAGAPPPDAVMPGGVPTKGAGGPRPRPDARTVLWIVAGLAAAVALARAHRITSLDILYVAALVPSVILHEVSHGVVALAFGDDTARRAGRITLNPLRHVDPVGTVILPVVMILNHLSPLGFAKPVPVNVGRLRRPRDHGVLVSLVGPAVNVVLALGCALALGTAVPLSTRLAAGLGSSQGVALSVLPGWAQYVFVVGFVNVILAAFNLVPLPPLDGSAVVERLLPASWLSGYYRIRPFTLLLPLVLVLWWSAGLADVFGPALRWWGSLLT